MKKIINKILAHDKLKHFFFGSLFAYLLLAFNVDSLLVIFLCGFLGLIKEMIDYFTFPIGKKEVLDVVYTIITSILLYLIK
jgi:hypothetical protein